MYMMTDGGWWLSGCYEIQRMNHYFNEIQWNYKMLIDLYFDVCRILN